LPAPGLIFLFFCQALGFCQLFASWIRAAGKNSKKEILEIAYKSA
jgi:hypothetical protein